MFASTERIPWTLVSILAILAGIGRADAASQRSMLTLDDAPPRSDWRILDAEHNLRLNPSAAARESPVFTARRAVPSSGFRLPDTRPAPLVADMPDIAGLTLYRSSARLTLQPEEAVSAPPADASEGGTQDLAKQLANPVASLISVPFQFNLDTGLGPRNTERLTLNIQPVIPFSISEDWNLITRTIVPVIYQGSFADGDESDFGIGDTVQSFFFSPKQPVGGWILAAGPVALWPTGTDPELRSEQLGFGPSALALRQDNGWTYGALVNHIWGVAESDDHPDVNATFLQPFLAYTWPSATTMTVNTESTYDWTGEQWTVPVNITLSQVVKFGDQPVQFFVGGRYYAETPVDDQQWGIRFGFTLLFPR